MPCLRTLTLLAICAAAACVRPSAPTPAPVGALSTLAAQQVIVLPTYAAIVQQPLDWSIGRPNELQRTLDNEIASAFEERGLKKAWVFPDQLAQSYRVNAQYATDPYGLAVEPLRRPGWQADARLPEPFASQVRTMVALYPNARLLLVPVELRLVPVVPRGGKGILRVFVVDARTARVAWVGEVESDPFESFGPALPASIAARLAAVVAPR
jgi:hypothetical protein